MSAEARATLWGALDGVPAAVALIGLAIADVVNDMHGNLMFASCDTIADKTGRDRSTVVRALKWMEDAGWLERTGRLRPSGVVEYKWLKTGCGEAPHLTPTGDGEAPQGVWRGATAPCGEAPHEPKRTEGEPSRARASARPVEPRTANPSNRSADRASCQACADTGYALDDQGMAYECDHRGTASPAPPQANIAMLRSMRAMRGV